MQRNIRFGGQLVIIFIVLLSNFILLNSRASAEMGLSSGCSVWNTLAFDGTFVARTFLGFSYHAGEQITVDAAYPEDGASMVTLYIYGLGVTLTTPIPGVITYTFAADYAGTIAYAVDTGSAYFSDSCGFAFSASAFCDSDSLVILIPSDHSAYDITGNGPGLPQLGVTAGTHPLVGPGTWTDVTVTEVGGNARSTRLGDFDCAATLPPPPPPILTGIPVPNEGLIQIDTGQAQFALQSPNGAPLTLSDGTPILLPADADHNGSDTYTVTGAVEVEGEFWVSIFLGDTTWGWVQLDSVTPLTYFELPAAE